MLKTFKTPDYFNQFEVILAQELILNQDNLDWLNGTIQGCIGFTDDPAKQIFEIADVIRVSALSDLVTNINDWLAKSLLSSALFQIDLYEVSKAFLEAYKKQIVLS